MSELGAEGSATHIISPLINNFPLGILFIAFGLCLISELKNSKLAIFSGANATESPPITKSKFPRLSAERRSTGGYSCGCAAV
ncbi:hypothetical protein [Nitrincola nitratireducens]|uniref:hypothetical protein n=1 Tax=Nitrincola nitratireducens TaxID=1229521 RepID=UPI0012FB17F5|nr:hypothetical protein [Nitrincola nitratireducens]